MAVPVAQPSALDLKHNIVKHANGDMKSKSDQSKVSVEVVEVGAAENVSGEYADKARDGGRRISPGSRSTLFGSGGLTMNGGSTLSSPHENQNLPAVGWSAVGRESNDNPTTLELFNGALPVRVDQHAIFIFIIGAITHFLTLSGCGWDWLLILLAFSFTYHAASMNRFRQYSHDDIARKVAKLRLSDAAEHAGWVNHILQRLWPIYEPLAAQEAIVQVNKVLNTNRPSFLDSLCLGGFTLGMKPVQVLQVKTHLDTPADVVTTDYQIQFNPIRHAHRRVKSGTDSRIVLSARIAGIEVPILVEDVGLSGWLRVRVGLSQEHPYIRTLEVSFVEKPVLHYALIPVGGDTFGFDVANLHVSGLSSFLQDVVHSTLSPMYHPNRLTLNIEELPPGERLESIFGVLMSTLFPTLTSPFHSPAL